MKKLFFIFLGSCTFALGTLGIFLPLLPTTCFYLLTAFFWMRSSDKLYNKFLASSYYQKYIQEAFFEKKITRKGKWKLFISMFLLFAIPCLIVRNTLMTTTLAIVYLAHVIGLSWYWRPKKKALELDQE
ncbi:TPA: YbaN family protein [Enterococcus faecalis]|nr:YbaN family protein [Enterococcus faecalis]